MGVLSGLEIRKRLADRDRERLVISPLLEPDEQVRKDQASVDIRLGFTFALISPSTHGAIDEFSRDSQSAIQAEIAAHYKLQYIPFGGKIVIHPHQFILASSLEFIRLPYNLVGQVIGRSTWGRLGLIVATAIAIQPNFAGTLALELRNLGETPLVLYPGQSIAQIFFHSIESPYGGADGIGQYSGSIELYPKDMSSPTTYRRLRRFIDNS